MSPFEKFTPFTKVDETSHEVYGLATAEIEDKAGEICDYAATKPEYEKWSAEARNATQASGQTISLGNIRKQHTMEVAGKATKIDYRDDDKQIFLGSRPIDDEMWSQIADGFYTGYSQAGNYLWRRCNDCGTDIPGTGNWCPVCKQMVLVRYAASIAELSYVDNPCLGSAHFTYVKADGTSEMRKFTQRLPITDALRRQRYDPGDNIEFDPRAGLGTPTPKPRIITIPKKTIYRETPPLDPRGGLGRINGR